MIIPKQLNWSEHIFPEREERASNDEFVRCPLNKYSCKEQCQSCTWLLTLREEEEQYEVTCRPPII
jgi:hypothetical protein